MIIGVLGLLGNSLRRLRSINGKGEQHGCKVPDSDKLALLWREERKELEESRSSGDQKGAGSILGFSQLSVNLTTEGPERRCECAYAGVMVSLTYEYVFYWERYRPQLKEFFQPVRDFPRSKILFCYVFRILPHESLHIY